MMAWLTALTLLAYAVAFFLYWADRSLRPLLLLVAGSIATLSQPLWVRLFASAPDVPGNVIHFGEVAMLPVWTVLAGGVLLALPPFVIVYGLRHGWWTQHYAAAWGFFVAFVLFFLILDAVTARSDITLFVRLQLPDDGRPETLLNALLLAGISFGMLYTFVSTRHFALQIAVVPLLLSGLATSLLLLGILCSPFWVARLWVTRQLEPPERLLLAAAVVSAALVLWAIHLLASGLHAGRGQRLQWR